MPTGYTYMIELGVDFPTFALRCGRAFGALVRMRDEPMDAEIPEVFAVNLCYANAVKVAEDSLARICGYTPHEIETGVDDAYAHALDDYERRKENSSVLRGKYENMLREVTAWEPPTTDHSRLKRFMIDQIKESIRFDCDFLEDYIKPPKKQSPAVWYAQKVEEIERTLKNAREDLAKEEGRIKETNEWLMALRKSIAW